MNNPKLSPQYLTTLENRRCTCGSIFWEEVRVIKFIPALMAGTPEPYPLQINTLRCIDCKKVMPEAQKLIAEPEQKKLTAL